MRPVTCMWGHECFHSGKKKHSKNPWKQTDFISMFSNQKLKPICRQIVISKNALLKFNYYWLIKCTMLTPSAGIFLTFVLSKTTANAGSQIHLWHPVRSDAFFLFIAAAPWELCPKKYPTEQKSFFQLKNQTQAQIATKGSNLKKTLTLKKSWLWNRIWIFYHLFFPPGLLAEIYVALFWDRLS